MAKRKRKAHTHVQHTSRINHQLVAKLAAALLAIGGTGGTVASYANSSHADERAAKLEVRTDMLERTDAGTQRMLRVLDRRSTRIETMLEVLVPASKRPPRGDERTHGDDPR